SRTQRIQYRSLTLRGGDSQLHFSHLNKIDSVRFFSLREEFGALLKSYQILTLDNILEDALDGGADLRGFKPSNLLCRLHSRYSICPDCDECRVTQAAER